MQFGVLVNMRLDEQRAAFWIEPGRKVVDHDLERTLLEAGGVGVVGGQRMPVCNEEEAIVLVLQVHPVAQRPDVVAEVQLAGGAHAAQDAAFLVEQLIGHQNRKRAFSNELKKIKNGADTVSTTEHPIIGSTNITITRPKYPTRSYTLSASYERKWGVTWLPSKGGKGIRLNTARITLIKIASSNILANGAATSAPLNIGAIGLLEPCRRTARQMTATNAVMKLLIGPATAVRISSRMRFLKLRVSTGVGFA